MVGFATAEATGVRPLGGVALLAGGVLAGYFATKRGGKVAAAITCGAYVGLFVASHPLAANFGHPWVCVTGVSVASAAVGWAVSDRVASDRVVRSAQ